MSQRMASGAVWMVLAKFVERILALISSLILVRLLEPADFGLVAMATSVLALLELFSAFGVDAYLIQHRQPDARHFHTAWTLNVLAGCAVGGLLALLSIPASDFYKEPRLVVVLCLLAASAAIQGFENIGVVEFRRQLEFDREFRYLLVKKLIGFLITVPLALWLRDYWALVIGTLAGRVGATLYSFMIHPFRPRFSLTLAAETMHFSKWLMYQNLLQFCRDYSSNFIIGRIWGPAHLGSFTIASEIASMPATQVVAPINRAILPGYSRLADDPAGLREGYLSVMAGIALLAVPAVVGVALAAPFVVLVLLGQKWLHVTPLLEILAFAGLSSVLQTNSYAAFLATGQPKIFAKINTIQIAILLVLLAALVPQWGVNGAAWSYLLASLCALPVGVHFITRALDVRALSLAAVVWRPVVSAALMYGIVRWLGPVPRPDASSTEAIVPFLGCVLMGAVVYVVSVLALWVLSRCPDGAESWLLARLKGGLRSFRARWSRGA